MVTIDVDKLVPEDLRRDDFFMISFRLFTDQLVDETKGMSNRKAWAHINARVKAQPKKLRRTLAAVRDVVWARRLEEKANVEANT